VTLEVLEPGLQTTVQDAGRPAWTHLGVPIGGAADPWSLAVANLLAGADAGALAGAVAGDVGGAAALEMTITGPTLAVREATTIGLAGADLGGVVHETGRRLAPGRSHALAAGTTIAFPGSAAPVGARCYLALPGGVDVPPVLGSASTLLSAGFGGVEGRALRPGDVVRGRGMTGTGGRELAWPWLDGDPIASLPAAGPWTLRIVAGPAPGAEALVASEWRVRPDSDRIGLRLEGPPVEAGDPAAGDPAAGDPAAGGGSEAAGAAGELVTHGVVRGAIQLPPGGGPLVLLADHQTTGGYPVAAVVARADHPLLGQLRPGVAIRFRAVTADEARDAFVAQSRLLARGAAALRGDDTWDELWRSAGR
jgi:antagonist of KipI